MTTAETLTRAKQNYIPIKPIDDNLTLLIPQLPDIQKVEEYLKRKAKEPTTAETYIKALKELGRRTNLKT